MFKLLIGYDGSACAADAIDDLHLAGLPPENVEAIVLSVADVLPVEPGPDYARIRPKEAADARERIEAALSAARQTAADGAERVSRQFPKWNVRPEAVGDSPYWGLVMKAQEWHANLLLVGSQGRSAVGRLVFGSVSQNAVLYADCSVRVGRCRPAHRAAAATAPVRFILGWDGSPDAQLALRAVARRAWPRDSECRMVTAVDARLETLLAAGKAPDDAQRDRDALLHRASGAADELRKCGLLMGDPVLRDGDPKHILLDEAETWRADCIFVGAKGLSGVRRVLLGSVSATVASRATCSVEVVRAR
jgi:nucleotide-binding universal stress UspA family protein